MRTAIRQTDLFATPQPDLLDGVEPDPQSPARMEAMVRPRLAALLDEARRAAAMPWTAQQVEVNALLFHNMANWLPEAERDRLRAAFRDELERLRTTS